MTEHAVRAESGATLAKLLDVDEFPGDCFAGQPQPWPRHRAFGGLLLAQSIAAAGRTMPERASVHSVHAVFVNRADPERQTEYAVRRVRDGLASGLRQVSARQGDREVCAVTVAGQRRRDSSQYTSARPITVPPEDLPTLGERFATAGAEVPGSRVLPETVDLRHVEPPPYLAPPRSPVPPRQLAWLRITEPLPDDPLVAVCALVYSADLLIGEPVFFLPDCARDPAAADLVSLDHALWLHGGFDAGEWLLYDQECLAATDGRVLNRASVYRRSGALVATMAQEGLLRVRGRR
ncbi:acyl-CoA thioesterase [Amycolatopsis silviterrae]|uniref:Acyl-CoA thioesterase n=1 Tax=Amycolatopsis silviterrae TaxID=1656914 RepID=A0ABW5H2T9_9PSEU